MREDAIATTGGSRISKGRKRDCDLDIRIYEVFLAKRVTKNTAHGAAAVLVVLF